MMVGYGPVGLSLEALDTNPHYRQVFFVQIFVTLINDIWLNA
jgi:hypothetical protein